MNMQRILRALILASFFVAAAAVSHAEPKRPNIVFILVDDLGYADVASYGSKYYETPNIDRLATEGVRFTDGYACGPNCQPTRAALHSGQYGPRTGVYTVGNIDRFNWRQRPLRPVDNVVKLSLQKVTLADSLRKAGYATGMFGKWHLGDDKQHHPSARGFDEAITSSGKHFNFRTNPPTEHAEDIYLADFLTDRAVDFINRHQFEPFFLYLPHYGVHAPYQAKDELIAKFRDKPASSGQKYARYAAMIASVDESVGRVLERLGELGLADNTLVIFSSDNGGVGGYDTVGLSKKVGVTDNSPLRGGKGTLYEGGIRVPYIFRWKGVIEPGRTETTPINSVDLYPTLVELAESSLPADYPLDGVSYASLLKGIKPLKRAKPLFWHFPGYLGAAGDEWRTTPVSAIRSGDWKLLEYLEDGHLELYNLRDDLSETNNLAAKESSKTQELYNQLNAWRQEINAPLPAVNKPDDMTDAPKGAKRGNKQCRAQADKHATEKAAARSPK